MYPKRPTALAAAFALVACSSMAIWTPPASAQGQPTPVTVPPAFATTKVSGTENVYIFRYQGHQSMFVVTSAGVIATDPIGFQRPQAVKAYIDEIRKVTDKPIKYVIYSHSHYDHIAGGKPFKDLGARFIAHKRAKEVLTSLKYTDVVIPDEGTGNRKVYTLGDTKIELNYVGRNHSDSSLVMRLPKERIIFAVDFIPIEQVMFRNMPDSWPVEWEASLQKVLAMDWDRLIPGHPAPNGRLGIKDDVKAVLTYLQDLSAETKKAADAGKCWDTAMTEVKLPKYEKWGNYKTFLPGNVERYCSYWARGF